MTEASSQIWTTWCDHYATGEGRAMMARVCRAATEQQCKEEFAAAFDPFYARVCEVQAGIARNAVTELLWSTNALNFMEKSADAGLIVAQSSLYMNFS